MFDIQDGKKSKKCENSLIRLPYLVGGYVVCHTVHSTQGLKDSGLGVKPFEEWFLVTIFHRYKAV